jgi:carbamate kinase
MLIVVALGGNAFLRRGEAPEAEAQRHRAIEAARALAPLTFEHDLVVCHGNGPQIGVLAAERESDPHLGGGYPLDVLGAETQGMIGYWLVQELANAGVPEPVVGLLTQTVVDHSDRAFADPTERVGPMYDNAEAAELSVRRGWSMARDGAGWRRVVASPHPIAIVERPVIEQLARTGATVVCAGGGGVPVVRQGSGYLGVEAVVDKDMTAATLAIHLKADSLVILTDVPGVMEGFGTPDARVITELDLAAVEHRLPAGSMGPKVEACVHFVRQTGRAAVIGALSAATEVLAGSAGTRVVAGRPATLV